MAGKFVVRGSGENIKLERYNDAGEATSARPAAPEELFMFQRVEFLEQANAYLREKLRLSIEFSRELAELPADEREPFLNRMANSGASILSQSQAT